MSENKIGLAEICQDKRDEIARAEGRSKFHDVAYMGKIGKLGGEAVSRNREHMSRIGKMGGAATAKKKAKAAKKVIHE